MKKFKDVATREEGGGDSSLLRLHLKTFLVFLGFFVWSFSSQSRIFHSFGDVTIAGEGLQILTYARH